MLFGLGAMIKESCQFVITQATPVGEETGACSLLARRCQLLISALLLAWETTALPLIHTRGSPFTFCF